MLTQAKYPPTIKAAPMSAANPDTVRDWTGAYAPPKSQAGETLRDHFTDMALIRRQAERAFGRRVNKGHEQ